MSELVKGPTQYQLNKLPRERILVTPNSNNPPTIVAGTAIYFNSAINTFALFTATTNQVFAWGAGLFPTITNSAIHYLWIDSSGVYGASKSADITVVKSEILDGWYSNDSTKKILARFYVDSGGNVLPGSICSLTNLLVYELYTTTTTAPSISGLDIIKDGGIYDINAVINMNSTANLYQYVNGDTTAANYYSQVGATYTNSALASDTPQIIGLGGGTVNGKISIVETIILGSDNKYSAKGMTDIHKNLAGVNLYFIVGDDETTTRTNITSISWALASGAFVAGSDIRIYRKS